MKIPRGLYDIKGHYSFEEPVFRMKAVDAGFENHVVLEGSPYTTNTIFQLCLMKVCKTQLASQIPRYITQAWI